MRILKILNSNDDGGVFTCEVQFIKEFVKKGVIVDAIILDKGPRLEIYKSLVQNVYEIDNLNVSFSGSPWTIIKNIFKAFVYGKNNKKRLASTLIRNNYTALIYRRANLLFLSGFLGLFLKTNVYWHMPNIVSNKFSYLFYNFIFRILNIKPVANSLYTQKSIGYISKHVIYPGFNKDRIIPKEITRNIKQELGISENTVIYGILARITHDKAQDIVVKAFLESDLLNEDVCLLIAGGKDSEEFENKVKEAAGIYLNNRIFLLGAISDVSCFYSSVDIIVNGRRNAEPFGISIAEALGAGKPVIAYHLGGPSEMIFDNLNGWLVKTPDTNGYLEAFNRSFRMKNEWKNIKENNISKSIQFSVETNCKKFLSILNKEYNYKS
ncbi:glycosyltransferase family 4 protein [Sphingobacterium litopenaei]|uniref:Glycosyltransferase family 4 protein n=1 Tax=Sphingobacterium litopenaei TaxID=2763500 RepID=A0ABR7YER9_9SPHI|nr:glycosyltransferase family 4 protein [Sphingobacterium litopenaei]MBD1429766.1 glycosyltransferase family 4 protein [Sphingobacterium litopenaei]